MATSVRWHSSRASFRPRTRRPAPLSRERARACEYFGDACFSSRRAIVWHNHNRITVRRSASGARCLASLRDEEGATARVALPRRPAQLCRLCRHAHPRTGGRGQLGSTLSLYIRHGPGRRTRRRPSSGARSTARVSPLLPSLRVSQQILSHGTPALASAAPARRPLSLQSAGDVYAHGPRPRRTRLRLLSSQCIRGHATALHKRVGTRRLRGV